MLVYSQNHLQKENGINGIERNEDKKEIQARTAKLFSDEKKGTTSSKVELITQLTSY